MKYFVSVESPNFTVTIHRGSCDLCLDGKYRSPAFTLYLSWSPEFDSYEGALEHIRHNFSFYRPAINCSACEPQRVDPRKTKGASRS